MHRKIVRHGFAALALAAALILAGAQPAAAAEDSRMVAKSLGWLSAVWGEIVDRGMKVGDGLGHLIGMWGAASSEQTEKGLGVDPNGNPSLAGSGPIDIQPGDGF